MLPRKLDRRVKPGAYVGLIILFVFMGLGCAGTQKTTKTETTVNYPTEREQVTTTRVTTSDDRENRGIVGQGETTTTTTETEKRHPGILSSTFHAVGYVISLPFIIIGGVFRMIFGG